MSKLIDLTGRKFGRWTVLYKVEPYKNKDGFTKDTQWLCRCDCGVTGVVRGSNLRFGCSRSCGCLPKDVARANREKRKSWTHN